jgi:hypothetical protein
MKNPAALIPGAGQAVQALIESTKKGDVPEATLELVHLRTSQINGCSFCVDSGYATCRHPDGQPVPGQTPIPFGLIDLPDLQQQQTAVISLGTFGHLMAAGQARSGRSAILASMTRSFLAGGAQVILVTPRPSPLRSLASLPGVAVVRAVRPRRGRAGRGDRRADRTGRRRDRRRGPAHRLRSRRGTQQDHHLGLRAGGSTRLRDGPGGELQVLLLGLRGPDAREDETHDGAERPERKKSSGDE